MRRIAVLSLHSSPLVQPGAGDSGGMNVYVRELAASLAQAGVDTTVYVRRWTHDLADVVAVEPGFRVVHVEAGDPALPKEALPETVESFTKGVLTHLRDSPVDVVHANYWLSGVAGHRIKHELDVPLVSTFHTLARVKAETGDPEPDRRVEAETEVIACSDVILASCTTESRQLEHLYGADPSRIEIVAPGVDHAFFSPGDRRGARRALAMGEHPVLLFVGRIQALKGLGVAVAALAELPQRDAVLLVVGGPSGADGERELARVKALAHDLDVVDRVHFVPPQPHHILSTYYRAADVCVVPSRSESFGLVALEATACGTPVVAASVGGLRTLVEDGVNGFLIEGRNPSDFAGATDRILRDEALAGALAEAGARRARDYTWSTTAARLRRVYEDLATHAPFDCAVG